MIAVAGCVAQAEGAEIPRRAREVDIVVGPQAYHRLPALVAEAAQGKRAIDLDLPGLAKFDVLPRRAPKRGASAFLCAGGLRQVLHLLCRPLHARCRNQSELRCNP